MVGVDLCELESAGRLVGTAGEPSERVHVTTLGYRRQVGELHVVDHAAVQRVLLDPWRPTSGLELRQFRSCQLGRSLGLAAEIVCNRAEMFKFNPGIANVPNTRAVCSISLLDAEQFAEAGCIHGHYLVYTLSVRANTFPVPVHRRSGSPPRCTLACCLSRDRRIEKEWLPPTFFAGKLTRPIH